MLLTLCIHDTCALSLVGVYDYKHKLRSGLNKFPFWEFKRKDDISKNFSQTIMTIGITLSKIVTTKCKA